ncbi:hypothetical protein FQA47_020080 [Oryzias melastigma]|uniref:Uncharacterized protein n=1 Tax=Oryzias melastigma TaxID=30732 RepID=A0A834FGU9_ORYME|nr:hypothetical protein FQA47_020080 [Oryzias melastigma]
MTYVSNYLRYEGGFWPLKMCFCSGIFYLRVQMMRKNRPLLVCILTLKFEMVLAHHRHRHLHHRRLQAVNPAPCSLTPKGSEEAVKTLGHKFIFLVLQATKQPTEE